MPDIDIQRGFSDIGRAGGTISISAVSSLSSAFLRMTDNRRTNVGLTASGTNIEADDISAALRLTATDTITHERVSTSLDTTARVGWEVWEYTGSPGGANEFIVRGRFQLTMGSGTRSTSAAVSGVVDHNRCIAFVQGHLCNHTSDAADSLTSTAYVDASDNLQVEKGGNNSHSVTVWVVVVEFTGSDWTVHHGRQEGGGASVDSGTITLRDESNGTGGSASSVSDWANAAIFHQFRANLLAEVDDSIADTSAVYYPGGTNGTVTYAHNANHNDSASAGSRDLHHVHVLEHADMAVTRFTDTGSGAGSNNVNIAAAGLTTIANASVEVSRHSSGNGTAYARGWVAARYTSTTNVELWVHRSGNTIETRIQVIDLSAIEDSGGGSVTGDLAATIGAPTMSASGTSAHEGALAATVQAPTMNAAGVVQGQASGDLAATIGAPAMSASGVASHVGAFAVDVPNLELDASGEAQALIGGPLAATVPALAAAFAGVAAHQGQADASVPVPTMAAAGVVQGQVSGDFAALVPALIMAAQGQRVVSGSLAASVPVLVLDADGTLQGVISGSVAAVLAALGFDAAGVSSHVGAMAAAIEPPAMASDGGVQSFASGDLAATIPAPVADIVGELQGVTSGALAATIPTLAADASGEVQGQASGDFAAEIPSPTMAADGDARAFLSGSLAATIPAPLADIAGSAAFAGAIGSMAADVPNLELDAGGQSAHVGALAAAAPPPTLDASGVAAHEGALASSVPPLVLEAFGQRVLEGAAAAGIPGLTMQAIGQRVVLGPLGGTIVLLELDAGGFAGDTLPFVALVSADAQTADTRSRVQLSGGPVPAMLQGLNTLALTGSTVGGGAVAGRTAARTFEPAPPIAPTPPSPYVAPSPTGNVVTTYAELAAEWALAGPRVIVVADGVYSGGGLQTTQGHEVWAQNQGAVTFRFGLGWRGNFGNAGGGVHGVHFDVDDIANVDPFALLNEAIVNTWDAVAPFDVGSGLVVEDCTFDGNGVVGSGIQAASPSGLTVRRCEFRRFIDVGISAFRNGSGPDDFDTITIEDVVVEDVARPVPGSGGGANAEHGLYLGHRFELRRFRIRDCAWSGVAVINDANGWTIEDGDIDRVGFGVFEAGSVGIYCEECHDGDIRRVLLGPEMKVGINCEWNRDDPDPWLNSLVPRNYDIRIDDVRSQAYKVGVHFDLSVADCIVRQSRLERAWLAGVLDNNTFPDSNGDFPPPMGQQPRTSTNVVDFGTVGSLLEPSVPLVFNDQHGGAALPPTIPGWPLDPLLVDVGLLEGRPGGVGRNLATVGTVPAARAYDVAMGLPWYVNEEDEGSVLSELAVYPLADDTLERPVDLSNVTDVELQYWDGAAWTDVGGIGSITSEVLPATEEREAGTYYRLEFSPSTGALQSVADTSGRGKHPRRWHLTITGGGDLHLPSVGWDILVINRRPG